MTRLPPEPATPLMHTRTYTVRAFYEQTGTMRLRGAILDEKPARLFFPEDDEPLPIHEMIVDLMLDVPSLTITDVTVVMEVTPHLHCTSIESSYEQLIGLSIGRGFSRAITERFGGVDGCTHIGALLRAMAPVAVQSMWSLRHLDPENSPVDPIADDEQSRREAMIFNLNSCHVWDEQSSLAQTALRGESIGIPVWAEQRLKKLGRPVEDWTGF
ncbi:MAG: DUF2889 domain-containing protein [Acidimicrobiales bacterium]